MFLPPTAFSGFLKHHVAGTSLSKRVVSCVSSSTVSQAPLCLKHGTMSLNGWCSWMFLTIDHLCFDLSVKSQKLKVDAHTVHHLRELARATPFQHDLACEQCSQHSCQDSFHVFRASPPTGQRCLLPACDMTGLCRSRWGTKTRGCSDL